MRFCVLNNHPERREGLKALLRQVDRQATFSEAKDWHQIESALSCATPDLLVVDWQQRMQVADLGRLAHRYPALPVAVLTDYAGPEIVTSLLEAGALGVVPRTLPPQVIVRAFELVLLGGHYVPADALNMRARPIPANYAKTIAYRAMRLPRGKLASLSPRQRQIMSIVHLGATNKVIARTLGISEGTVKIHLASVFQQLGATNRAAAVALYNGWQFEQLDVLHNEADVAPRPRLGQAGPLPLRRQPTLGAQRAAYGAAGPGRLAAEPEAHYAGGRLAGKTLTHGAVPPDPESDLETAT